MPPAFNRRHLLSRGSENVCRCCLGSVVEGFGKDATTVQGIVNYLANGCNIWVYVHAVACAKMTDNAFGRDFEGAASQFRVATRLYVVNHLQTLGQWKRLYGNHFSSAPLFLRPSAMFKSEGPVLVTI
jgi:hypothetical protein